MAKILLRLPGQAIGKILKAVVDQCSNGENQAILAVSFGAKLVTVSANLLTKSCILTFWLHCVTLKVDKGDI